MQAPSIPRVGEAGPESSEHSSSLESRFLNPVPRPCAGSRVKPLRQRGSFHRQCFRLLMRFPEGGIAMGGISRSSYVMIGFQATGRSPRRRKEVAGAGRPEHARAQRQHMIIGPEA